MSGVKLDKNHIKTLIEWEAYLYHNNASPLSDNDRAQLQSIESVIHDDVYEAYGDIEISPSIVNRLLAADGATEYLADVNLAWQKLAGIGGRGAVPLIGRAPTYFYPRLKATNISDPLFLDLKDGDMIRSKKDEFGRTHVVGKFVHVTEEGAYIRFRDATLFYSHEDLKDLPKNWEIVRPFPSDEYAAPYPKVLTFQEEIDIGRREDELLKKIKDPRQRAIYRLNGYLADMEDMRKKAEGDYQSWREAEREKISFSKYVKGYYNYFSGDIYGLADIRDYVEPDKKKEWEDRFAEIDREIENTKRAIDNLSGGSNSVGIDHIIKTSVAKSLEEMLDAKLEAIGEYNKVGRSMDALAMAAGGVWIYRGFQSSLTSVINGLIENDLIDADIILSSKDLEGIKGKIAGYNKKAASHNRVAESVVSYSAWPIIDLSELEAEIVRLGIIDEAVPDALDKARRLLAEMKALEKDIGREKVWRFFRAFGSGFVDVLDDPATLIMVMAGAGAGAIGRGVASKLAAAGFGATSIFVTNLAVEGIAFHNLSNVFNFTTDPFENSNKLDWGAGGNIEMIITLGWLKAAGKAHGKIAEATYARLAKSHPSVFRAIHHGTSLATESVAFTAQGVAKKSIIEDQDITWEELADILARSTQMVMAFRALRAMAGRKGVYAGALEDIDKKIIATHERLRLQGTRDKNLEAKLRSLVLKQQEIRYQVYEELKDRLKLALKMRRITKEEYESKIKEIEAFQKIPQEIIAMFKKAANRSRMTERVEITAKIDAALGQLERFNIGDQSVLEWLGSPDEVADFIAELRPPQAEVFFEYVLALVREKGPGILPYIGRDRIKDVYRVWANGIIKSDPDDTPFPPPELHADHEFIDPSSIPLSGERAEVVRKVRQIRGGDEGTLNTDDENFTRFLAGQLVEASRLYLEAKAEDRESLIFADLIFLYQDTRISPAAVLRLVSDEDLETVRRATNLHRQTRAPESAWHHDVNYIGLVSRYADDSVRVLEEGVYLLPSLPETEFFIGRDPGADGIQVEADNPYIGREHAKVVINEDGAVGILSITGDSKSGAVVTRKGSRLKVPRNGQVELLPGDIMSIINTHLEFDSVDGENILRVARPPYWAGLHPTEDMLPDNFEIAYRQGQYFIRYATSREGAAPAELVKRGDGNNLGLLMLQRLEDGDIIEWGNRRWFVNLKNGVPQFTAVRDMTGNVLLDQTDEAIEAKIAGETGRIYLSEVGPVSGVPLPEKMRPFLRRMGDAEDGWVARVIPLEKGDVTIGRGEDMDIRLEDRTISRRLARILMKDGKWYIVKLNARYGLKIQPFGFSKSLEVRARPVELRDKDKILLGPDESFEFCLPHYP